MNLLIEKIINEGKAISSDILKVDSFLNHQLDPHFLKEVAFEFAKRFSDTSPTRILTVEASGIAVATMVGLVMHLPVVYAKKKKASTMMGDVYKSKVKSFTRNEEYYISVSSDYLSSRDRVLIIDDFLARGNAVLGLIDIVGKSGASLEGVGIVIEKGFQEGGKRLREKGIRLESLAVIKSLENGRIAFA